MSLPNNKEDSKMNLGEKIKERRKQAGLSQEQLIESRETDGDMGNNSRKDFMQ